MRSYSSDLLSTAASSASGAAVYFGSDGTMMLDDDHTEHMLYTDKGIPHAYLKDRVINFAFLGGHSAGDWMLGKFWGGMANEVRTWLDHLSLGGPIPSTTRTTRCSIKLKA